MLIISKFKDYYDYLTGYYGVDPKLVLDRRSVKSYQFYHPEKIIIFICGKRVEGLFDGKQFHYGEKLKEFGTVHKRIHRYYSTGENYPECVDIIIKSDFNDPWRSPYDFTISTEIVDDFLGVNKMKDCPIILATGYSGYRFQTSYHVITNYPKLSDLNFGSVYSPDEIFIMLSTWLSNRNTEKENILDTRNDVQKLESKGFDKKRSFRPKMKK